MTQSPGGYLSFLDLMCCSFGGALLLLLLVASASTQPPKQEKPNAMLVVRYAHEKGARPEVRIECRRPGRDAWERVDRMAAENPVDPSAFAFSAPATADGGGETFAVIYDPREGLWEFRAYLVGFPKDGPRSPVTLTFYAEGDQIDVAPAPAPPAGPLNPGDFTPVRRVTVTRTP